MEHATAGFNTGKSASQAEELLKTGTGLLVSQRKLVSRRKNERRGMKSLWNRAPALKHADQYHDQREDKQDVYEAANRIRRDEAQQPQHKEYDRDRCKQIHNPASIL
jgi:hypothetical protein